MSARRLLGLLGVLAVITGLGFAAAVPTSVDNYYFGKVRCGSAL